MQLTYLTTEELAERIKYSKYHIRNHLVDNVLIEGLHYTLPLHAGPVRGRDHEEFLAVPEAHVAVPSAADIPRPFLQFFARDLLHAGLVCSYGFVGKTERVSVFQHGDATARVAPREPGMGNWQ